MTTFLKPFESMTSEDYAAIGLRCGLEVHQQLHTRTKLFCRCPAGRYSKEYDAEILRHMRPTLSELGEYDGTALMEKKTNKNIYYRLNSHTVCTYEFDDTPPFFMAEDALDIAMELALFLNLNLVNELHISRKQYLDGTIPTGFQRTTILGVDGWLPYDGRRIGVAQLGLEEDACREVSDKGHDRVLLTDRLGMPLIEVVTNPDMTTPEETAEVCEVIRKLCRSTGKVRTGYGAAREDVNVSVRGGTRIEIKGVPQISRIPRLVYNEARRQCALLAIREELKQRGVTPETFQCHHADVTSLVARSNFGPIQTALAGGQRVRCVVLRGFARLLNESTQENTTFAKEFSDRIRVIACLTELPNMVHSDDAWQSLRGDAWMRMRRKLRAADNDAMILTWGTEKDAKTACEEIEIRARQATMGIPSDTRQPLKDGTNGFERVLPGAERMYPDTDLPPIEIEEKRLRRIRDRLPLCSWDRQTRCREMGLTQKPLVDEISISPRAGLLFRVVDELGIDPTFAAVVLIQKMKAWQRAGYPLGRLSDDLIYSAFNAFAQRRLTRQGLLMALTAVLNAAPTADQARPAIDAILLSADLVPLPAESLADRVRKEVDQLDESLFSSDRQKHRFLMGRLMAEYRGRVDGRSLSDVAARYLDRTAPVDLSTRSPA